MSTTNDMLYHLGGVPVGVPISQGKCFFVKPYSGNDACDGLTPATACKTLLYVHDNLVVADRNDTVFILSESNTAAYTTDYLSAALVLSKDGVRYIGVNSGSMISQRSRLAWISTMTASVDTVMVTISGDNCYFANLSFFCGINDANLSFNVKVTGSRNVFENCHFAGIGHDTNDAAGAYSLCLSGAAECLFKHCMVGLDTIARGTSACSELLISAATTRCRFEDCEFRTYAEATGHQFIIKDAAGIDRDVTFKNCDFINSGLNSGGTKMLEAIDYTASTSPGGCINLINCSLSKSVDDWEAATVSGEVFIFSGTSTAATAGLSVAVAAS